MPLSPRLKWKIRKYKNSLEEFKGRVLEAFQGAVAKQKVCPACRALVSGRERECPFCNESLSTIDRVAMRRLATGFLPEINYTIILLAANFFFFALSLIAAAKMEQSWQGLIRGFPGYVLVNLGANYTPAVARGQYWRLVSYAFLHGNLMHLLFNTMVLLDVAPSVEEMYGTSRFLTLYLFTSLTASLASLWYHPIALSVGASGALFGLIGVMITYGYHHRTALGEQVRSMYLRWAIYAMVFGMMMPGTDNAAHFGGLAGGVLFGYFVSDMPSVTRESIFFWRIMNYACWLTLTACLILVALNYSRT